VTVLKKVRLVLGMVALAMVLAACSSQSLPQDSLDPQGPYARKIDNLFDPVFWIAVGVFVLVEGVLVFSLFRFRHRPGRTIPAQTHGNTRLEITWTILPALLLAGISVPTVATVLELNRRPTGQVLDVNVSGHQWWWQFDYPQQKISVSNELHIPTGENVYVSLCAVGLTPSNVPYGGDCGDNPPPNIGDAVIHSFWVPKLNGKQDVVPGRTNHLTLFADHPGVYPGQCYEYCGMSHANMKFKVIAQTPADFQAWVAQQQAPAVSPPAGSLASKGEALFTGANGEGGQCIACHSINGLQNPQTGQPLAATGGPNLTHFASRSCFAGCYLDNTPEDVARWLANPPAVKPGSFMPDYNLSPDQIEALTAYLESLT
jgi:cytochrome c oxidase subunit II